MHRPGEPTAAPGEQAPRGAGSPAERAAEHGPLPAIPAAPSRPARRRGTRLGTLIRDVVEAVVLAGVLFAVLQLALQNTVVEGSSMRPNFVDGQRLLVNKLAYRFGRPARGDVVVFHAPDRAGQDFIKRIIGLPGETVAIHDGRVLIDGQVIDEPWLPVPDATSLAPVRVPDAQYFVLGDNRPFSNDSRTWGEALPQERIVGKAWFSVWPRETWGLVRPEAPGPAYGLTGS